MRKGRIAALCAVFLAALAAGCGAEPEAEPEWPFTMEELVEANRTAALLEKYGSVQITSKYEEGIDTSGLVVLTYADSEIVYSQSDEARELYASDGAYLYADGVYGAVLGEDIPDSSGLAELLDETSTKVETIRSVEEDGDKLRVQTSTNPDKLKALYAEDGAAYTEGDYTVNDYVMNAEDLSVLSDTVTLYHKDGSFETIGTTTAAYGVPRPANAQLIYDHMTAPDRRTVTIVLDPGTKNERELSVSAAEGDVVFPYLPEGYYQLYKDEDCKEVFDGAADLYEDLTLYGVYENRNRRGEA